MFELRPHQETAITKMHNGCILCGGTGVGKTHTTVGYYLQNEAPKPVYVITTAKKRDKGDWQTIWGEVGMHKDPELTMGAVVIVDSWENIKKYQEVTDAFFIFDEQRLVGTGAWVKAFYKIAANNRWVMLSATPGDNWLDYVPVFRANGFIKNLTQFKEDHVLSRWTGKYYQVTGYRQVAQLVRWRNQLLVDMPYERHTTRHSHDVPCTYDVALIRKLVKERWHVLENRPLQDASELFRVMRRVVYSDTSRLQQVRGLLTKHPKLIVFYNFDFELEILRTLANPSPLAYYETSQPSAGNTQSIIESPTTSGAQQSVSGPAFECQGHKTEDGKSLLTCDDWTAIFQPRWEKSDWPYLLSPEGKEANTRLVDSSTTPIKTSTNPSPVGSPKTLIEPLQRESESTTPSTFQVAEWNGHKHEEIPETDSWVYLVQYVAGAEAWETTDTDAICFYSMPYSYKLWHQSHGRIDRLSTSFLDLHYYRLMSDAVIEKAVAGALDEKRSFNESAFVEKTGFWKN